MRRRSFLLSGGGGALVMLGPRWLRRAFGDASLKGAVVTEDPRFGDLARRRALAEAKARALAAGRPLLVFVIPTDERQKWDRGHAFGELLAHGTPAELAPLASVELACATLDDLGARASGKEDPLLARFDPRTNRLRLVSSTRPLPPLDPVERRALDPQAGEQPLDEDRYIEKRIAVLADLIEQTLGAARSPALGRQVAGIYRGRPPAGTHWAAESGCGPISVEETPEERAAREAAERRHLSKKEEVVGYDCGMGHVPEKSARFLYFFTKKPGGL